MSFSFRMLLLPAGLLLVLPVAAFGQADPPAAPCEAPRVEPWPPTVSIIQLIANPERYDGQRVQVVGFVRLEFEGTAIYLHHTDYQYGVTTSGLWLQFDAAWRDRLCATSDASNRYAYVQGVFHADNHGHIGLFSGSLSDLTRLDPSSPVLEVSRQR
jgi:hypothetical protein